MKEENGGTAPARSRAPARRSGKKQNKGDFEQLLDKMLDTQKVFSSAPART